MESSSEEPAVGTNMSMKAQGSESPGQSKVGAVAAKTSLDQLFVQYMCTVIDEINGNYLQLP